MSKNKEYFFGFREKVRRGAVWKKNNNQQRRRKRRKSRKHHTHASDFDLALLLHSVSIVDILPSSFLFLPSSYFPVLYLNTRTAFHLIYSLHLPSLPPSSSPTVAIAQSPFRPPPPPPSFGASVGASSSTIFLVVLYSLPSLQPSMSTNRQS